MTYRFGGVPSRINKTKRFRFWVWLQQEWMTVLLTFITLEIAILSIERANWLESQPSLTFVLILSIITGVILAKRKFRRLVNWSVVIAGGLLVTAWQTLSVLPPSQLPWYERLGAALESFWGVVSMSRPDEISIHFVIFLVLVTWFLGYISTWFVLRRQNAWSVVISGAVVLLINLSNLPSNYYGFLIFFLIFAMLLIGQVRLVKNNTLVENSGTKSSYRITRFLTSSLLSISILAATITWLTPNFTPGRIATIDTDETPILKNVGNFLDNFLARVPRKQPLVAAEDQGEYLFTGNYERFGDDAHFVITSDTPQYWRTWVYDFYKSSGWTNSEVIEYSQGQETLKNEDYLTGRKEITFDVEVLLKTDILLTAGQFISSDTPVSLHSLVPAESGSPDEQPTPENIVAAVTPYTLDVGQKYTVTSSIISASPGELAEAGTDYPEEIKQYYLQLPDSLPERIRILSANITANATTPYEKVLAIGDYLSQFSYNLKADNPPEGVDAVEFFCFNEKSGACGDFATAMVVLLRAAGVPSRFCTGYRYGELDDDSGKYVVLVSNRHAWAEVYFPEYGWAEFESTPGSSSPRGIVGVEAFTGGGATEIWDPYRYMQDFKIPSTATSPSSYQPSKVSLDTTSVVLFWPFLFLGIGIPVAILMYIVFFRRRKTRDSRPGSSEYESEVYAGMCELAERAHLGPLPYQTPLEYCAQLVSEFPLEKDSIQYILDAFLARRYRPENSSDQSESMTWRLMKARRSIYDAIRDRLRERGKRA